MKAFCTALCLLFACTTASEIVSTEAEAPGSNCASGGIAIHEGVDDDGDGTLDRDEIDSTNYVCSGSPNGSALVATSDEAAGDNCPNGGTSVRTGLDANGNAVLDEAEVQSTVYVCNGIDGTSQLVATQPEQPGNNCTMGGIAILVGTDLDRDGVLDSNEVTSTSYVCDGV